MRDSEIIKNDTDLTKYTTRISELSSELMRLINDLLNISRIEQNRLSFNFKPVNISALIIKSAETFNNRVDKNKINYILNLEKDEVIAELDETLFIQCIENVIDNSVKYTKEGSITLESKVETEGASKYFVFTCTDTGIGIDHDSLGIIFQKFARARTALDSGLDGTGIGMFLAKEIITSHHGTIDIYSEGVGKGVKTVVKIPLQV
jgi:signal transduction histidine kinase